MIKTSKWESWWRFHRCTDGRCGSSEVDFASIGTNDLCQYLMAVDRLNPSVAKYYQSFHPAMFRLIKQIAEAFTSQGKTGQRMRRNGWKSSGGCLACGSGNPEIQYERFVRGTGEENDPSAEYPESRENGTDCVGTVYCSAG